MQQSPWTVKPSSTGRYSFTLIAALVWWYSPVILSCRRNIFQILFLVSYEHLLCCGCAHFSLSTNLEPPKSFQPKSCTSLLITVHGLVTRELVPLIPTTLENIKNAHICLFLLLETKVTEEKTKRHSEYFNNCGSAYTLQNSGKFKSRFFMSCLSYKS